MKYFLADTHFGCWKLVQNFPRLHPVLRRPFENIEEHDTYLIDEINARIKDHKKDELFILGDMCFKKPGKYRSRIKCRHVRLIRGNHDPVQASRNVFGEIPYKRVLKLRGEFNGGPVTLHTVVSHEPYAFWEGSHKGWAHLYGHCHGQREATMDMTLPNRRSLDVGVDWLAKLTGCFRPLSEQAIITYMLTQTGHDMPTFYPNNRAMKEIAQR